MGPARLANRNRKHHAGRTPRTELGARGAEQSHGSDQKSTDPVSDASLNENTGVMAYWRRVNWLYDWETYVTQGGRRPDWRMHEEKRKARGYVEDFEKWQCS